MNCGKIHFVEFQEWINQKYLDWRGDKIGREGSVSKFAEYLRLSQPVVRSWLKEGKVPNEKKNIDALISRYGSEVYDILDIGPVNESFVNAIYGELLSAIDYSSESKRAQVMDGLSKVLSEGQAEGLTLEQVKARFIIDLFLRLFEREFGDRSPEYEARVLKLLNELIEEAKREDETS